ncbi:MAG: ADP-ribose pyrophosphatase of COG1058 family / Nicotinamide-nucleotide amidase [uncultured Frankineae bacterium]|uniref:CinA-like protein n=1 Tax=uncultured Frankineae bacterium TaxID=437475 RepID=A0A6J4M7D6_9ACTN|nr:MAG: ADP-ribose pyrophosphatase of COG1058 family / Nicotinamide-nucleotide amidase [uncultured Frankineae bacterium]
MSGGMRSAVVAVGDELLLGDIVNGNAAWLGERLAAAGAPVVHSSMVGDDVERIATAVRRALEDADVVLVTGGLGPTSDDVTRDAVAAVAGVPLERWPDLEQGLRERFAAYRFEMPDTVLRQADVPKGAAPLDNPVGTAPGLRIDVDGRLVFALPGPPHELAAVATGGVLAEIATRSGTVGLTRTLHCAGRGESNVAEIVERTITVPPGVDLAYLAGGAVVRVRLTTVAPTVADADRVLAPLVDALVEALGDTVFGRDGDTLPGVVLRRLTAAGSTVAVAESLTGGLVGAALSELPGSSAAFRGGLEVYATDLKASLAGVPEQVLAEHGAVSPQTAQALAVGVRERLGATYGVGLTGVAGPDEQEGKPAGTVHAAVAGPDGVRVVTVRLPGDRQRVRLLAVTSALDLLRRALPPEHP